MTHLASGEGLAVEHGFGARASAMLRELVGTSSVSGQEHRAARVFARHAQELGFEVSIDRAGNAIAVRGAPESARDAREICLLGHIDTVPGGIPVRVEGGVLHGRGAVDAKGPLMALLAGASLAELGPGVRVRVVAAVGEETPDSPGARYLVDRIRPDACIVGEPSGWDGVTLGYKGRLLVECEAGRGGAHSAGPESSAPDAVFSWWRCVLELVDEINGRICTQSADEPRVFDRLQASLSGMGTEHDGLRDRAWCMGGFRLGSGVTPEELEASIRARTGADLSVQFTGHTPAHATGRSDPVVRALSASIADAGTRARHKHKTGTADLNVVGPVWGCPIAAYGPGDSSLDHTPVERIELDEFVRSIGVVRGAVARLGEELTHR